MKGRLKGSGSLFHSFARPVAGVLVHSGQGIKQCAFSHVWISCQRDGPWRVLFGSGSLPESLSLRFHEDIAAVPVPDGDDCSADQESAGIAGRTAAHAGNFCIHSKSQIQEPPPELFGTGKLSDAGALPGL